MSDKVEENSDQNSGVSVQNVQASQSGDVGLTMEQGKEAAPSDPNTPSADSLGVTSEQFDKYFDAQTGQYNWQAHAKEAEFKVEQKASQDSKSDQADKTEKPSEADERSIVEKAGLDFNALEAQIVENGDIDQAAYDALLGIGIPEDTIKQHIQGIKNEAANHVENVMNAFGGEDVLEKIADWAQQNYTPEEIKALEDKLSDPAEFKVTADMLIAKSGISALADGKPVNAPNASEGGSGGVKGYANQAEMIADQRKPEYKTDPSFRAEVAQRAAASTWENNPRAHTAGL